MIELDTHLVVTSKLAYSMTFNQNGLEVLRELTGNVGGGACSKFRDISDDIFEKLTPHRKTYFEPFVIGSRSTRLKDDCDEFFNYKD